MSHESRYIHPHLHAHTFMSHKGATCLYAHAQALLRSQYCSAQRGAHAGAFEETHPHGIYKYIFENATYCNMLQHTATRCNTLQHSGAHAGVSGETHPHGIYIYLETQTRCNTLQHFTPLWCTREGLQGNSLTRYMYMCETATHCNTLGHARKPPRKFTTRYV